MNRFWFGILAILLAARVGGARAETLLERGAYLMRGVAACGNCHAARGDKGQILAEKGLSGGMVFDEPQFKAQARNLTPDPETGIGNWTDAQLAKAIREGVRPDKSVIGPPMPVEFYRRMSDRDVAAIIVWLRTQPPVRNEVPKSVYKMPLPPNYGPALKTVKAPAAGDRIRYGEYLVTIGHCMECHSPRNAKGMLQLDRLGVGGRVFDGPWGQSVSRNLTPHGAGLKDWSDAQIATAVRDGVDRNGNPYRPPMGYEFYRNISDADIGAIVAYLRTLKPQAPAGTR